MRTLMTSLKFLINGFLGTMRHNHKWDPSTLRATIEYKNWVGNLKTIVEGSTRNVEFFYNKPSRLIVLFSTTNCFMENPNLCFLMDWRSVILILLVLKVKFKVIICISNSQSFNNLVFTFNGQDFNDKFSMEYGFCMASNQEVPLAPSSSSWMNKPLLIYAYLS